MVVAAVGLSGYWLAVWVCGAVRCWRDTGVARGPGGTEAHRVALSEQRSGCDICKAGDRAAPIPRSGLPRFAVFFMRLFFGASLAISFRRRWHSSTRIGSISCRLTRSAARPVIFGAVGGVGLLVGSAGLIWCKMRSDRAPMGAGAYGLDYDFLGILGLTALTGLLTLALRATPALEVCWRCTSRW